MPRFKRLGVLKVPKHNREMLVRWSDRAAAYDAEHASSLSLTAVYDGKVATKKNGLNLDDPPTRANILAGIESSLGLGLSGVQLDLEPYPTSPGFISLLEELDAMFARVGFHGRLSVAAPASTSRWSPAYLNFLLDEEAPMTQAAIARPGSRARSRCRSLPDGARARAAKARP